MDAAQSFQRVAIVNRGEPAMRFIRATRELAGIPGARPRITTIALYTEPDAKALFVREADEAFPLGAASYLDPSDGRRRSSYLDLTRLSRALVATRADAAWVGWGFVSEHAGFAELCARLGVVFIGPSAATMRRLADKISAKRLAVEAGLPVLPWSGGPVETLEEAQRRARELGFPLMLKAAAGGGGRGIRAIDVEEDLPRVFDGARAEALAAFGDPTVFLERRVDGARHVEVQIVGDRHGGVWAVGVRDCTLQRRHQKVMEEAPSPALDHLEEQEILAAAARLARLAGYENAGTVEFLFDAETRRFSFMEVNARLQVEHPVTEVTTGLDLVKLQIHVARGGRLLGDPPPRRGHAVEVRINAEDPDNDFAPAPGRIELLRLPSGPGLRVDAGVAEGDSVAPEFDSMIAKIVAHGQDRDEALGRIQRALAECAIVIRGGASNKPFLLGLLARPELARGTFDNAWLDSLAARGEHVSRDHADVALIAAATEAYGAALGVERAAFLASAARGRPEVRAEPGRKIDLGYRGGSYRLHIQQLGPSAYRIDAGAGAFEVEVERQGVFERRVSCGGARRRAMVVAQEGGYLVEVEGVPHRVARQDGGVVRSPTPAMVLTVAVKPGEVVSVGSRLVTLEAMKMELAVTAPFAGRVREVLVTSNVQVAAGAPLLQLEVMDGEERRTAPPVQVTPRAPADDGRDDARTRWTRAFAALRRLLLGYDVEPAEAKRIASAWTSASAELPADDAVLRGAEEEALSIFADVHALLRRQPAEGEIDVPDARSAREYLTTYARTLDTQGDGLPASFLDKLGRALAHQGVVGLAHTPELEDALVRIYKSHERGELAAGAVASTLERWLARLAPARDDGALRGLLERLLAAARDRFPVVFDLAREVRYHLFDQPVFEEARDRVYAEVEGDLTALSGDASRQDLVARLVECPQPLAHTFLERFEAASPRLRGILLEVLTRRYYRIRDLSELGTSQIGGQHVAFGAYDHEGKRIHVFTTHARCPAVADALSALSGLVGAVPLDRDVVVDVFAWSEDPLAEPDVTEAVVRAALCSVAFPRPIRRAVVVAASPGRGHGAQSVQHFTYRPAPGGAGFVEEALYRGAHPMLAKRMHFFRLQSFALTRLPSAEDVYLFHARAHDHPKDERLFAVAEVRDLTPVRDARGRIQALPHLERMLLEALAAIRLYQGRRAPHERLQYGRVLLYVWPPLLLDPDERDSIVRRLAPETEGLGLDQVVVHARMPDPSTGAIVERVMRIAPTFGHGLRVTFGAPHDTPLRTLSEYEMKVAQLRRRGLVYPYEIVKLLTPREDGAEGDFPRGEFVEHDLDDAGRLVPVVRPYGENGAHVVAGVIRSYTPLHPEGIARVILLGDPSKEMGSVSESECRRVLAALDLAESMRVPLEWFTLSAGAKISTQSGTENMDWVAAVLRRLITFTQAGGEVNVVVCGINVGAQPYWNAEATMLMHTRGILVMTPESAMVLTGKQALDYSGSVSAEDNLGIGGYDRVMGPNGQAQYYAEDIGAACRILLAHYAHTYVAPGERFPRRALTADPTDRDIREATHPAAGPEGFASVGEIFSDERNPGRKKAFEIRSVMTAVVDRDHRPLERWKDMRDAETAVIWDARIGGFPVCLVGMESHSVRRLGFVPADGPEQWTAGTLFPQSSRKVARAINAASDNRPLVVLANLSGFDGSPESMRHLQLEYGAEIGRAVVNFRGPIVFCVISRYHGGAFVVFSRRLNEGLEAAALTGTHASVIGGAPAAAVVFSRDVDARTSKDARVAALTEELARASGEDKRRLTTRLAEVRALVRSEKLGEVAEEFDRIHSVERARDVGSLDVILPPDRLRPYLVEAIERGMARSLGGP
jgi:acetyl/propionyl-CoA carboxylase alpha subunit/acetyl-CoA carboxylase carboxyltransferase component